MDSGGTQLQEIGIVISVNDRSVTVEVKRKDACSTCGRCGGHLSLGGDSMIVEAVKTGNPKPGDLVKLELPDDDYLRLSFLVYMLPLLCLGLGYAGGWFLGKVLGNPSVWGAMLPWAAWQLVSHGSGAMMLLPGKQVDICLWPGP
jgi:positive regulator of sigma E activity